MKEKHCPLCNSDAWNYDVFAFGQTYCGNCYDRVKRNLWDRLRDNRNFLAMMIGDKPYPKRQYFSALLEEQERAA